MFKGKKSKIILICIATIMQVSILINIIMEHKTILKEGAKFKMKAKIVDPYDPFRGRFIKIQINESIEIETTENIMQGDTIKIALTEKEGFAEIEDIKKKGLKNSVFIKTRVKKLRIIENKENKKKVRITIDLPLKRFYMKENIAKKVEALIQKRKNISRENTYITFRVLNGKALIENLYIDNTPIKKLAKRESLNK